MLQANHLIVKAGKYFPIMQVVYFELFFLSDEQSADFPDFSQNSYDSRSFKAGKVFQGLSVTESLSPSL